MSRENIVRFMERLVEDREFAAKLGPLEGDGGPESVRRLIEVASVAGYAFTEEDLDDLFRGMAQRSSGELGEEQLERVAGGAADMEAEYLELQDKLQNTTRQLSLVSNVLKTKHDTAKNSISNIR